MSAGPVELEDGFAARIASAAGNGSCVRELTAMPGGHSGLTHRVVLESSSGHDVVVVKSTPPGRRPRGRHDVLRQARLIDALAEVPGVPVPGVRFCDPAPPPFFATTLAPGEAVDPVIREDDGVLAPACVADRWDAAIAILAALHAIDPGDLGAGSEPVRTPAEELELWCATMRAAGMGDDPGFAALHARLRGTVPAGGRPAIVHGDYRLGNIMFEDSRATAVIDWEIWSVGDPLVDVGWFVQFTDAENHPGIGRDAPGTPDAASVLARYRDATGDVREGVEWFVALGCLKLAAVQAHNRRRHLDGRFRDPFQARLGAAIDAHLRRGADVLGG